MGDGGFEPPTSFGVNVAPRLSDRQDGQVSWIDMNYFYVLHSMLDDAYYYGSTTNLKKRVAEHNNKKVNATRYRLPVELVYYEAYTSISAARKREHQVKKSGSIRTALLKRIAHP